MQRITKSREDFKLFVTIPPLFLSRFFFFFCCDAANGRTCCWRKTKSCIELWCIPICRCVQVDVVHPVNAGIWCFCLKFFWGKTIYYLLHVSVLMWHCDILFLILWSGGILCFRTAVWAVSFSQSPSTFWSERFASSCGLELFLPTSTLRTSVQQTTLNVAQRVLLCWCKTTQHCSQLL